MTIPIQQRINYNNTDMFSSWSKVYLYHKDRMLGGYADLQPALKDSLNRAIMTYMPVEVNSAFHYVITGQNGRLRKDKLDNFILRNFTCQIYYYQLRLWFGEADQAMLYKLLYNGEIIK